MCKYKRGWFKSSYSASGNCVEVWMRPGSGVRVRDSKAESRGPVLVFTADEWAAFVTGVRGGQFDAAC
ncbi:MAG TPA: DUF397 domain-containing protein [Mycobacteriales bacterium]|nr:DUF397 domain-containing protein [Mycobacteriales bacterium]